MAASPPPLHPARIGVVTGLASEAAIVMEMLNEDDPQVRIACAGASAKRAAVKARELVDAGVHALLSFGIAGALDPALSSGDLIVADEILVDEVGDAGHCQCDRTWLGALHNALAEARLPYSRGVLVGSHRLWRDAKDKEAIFETTGCPAIDMESGAVATIAFEAGLPFLAVRAVADRARDSLPSLVETAVRPDGRTAVGRAITHLARHPSEILAALRLSRQSELALAKLRMLAPMKDALLGGF